MLWFILARGLFITAIGYSAYQLQPFEDGGITPNIAFGIVLGALIVALEIRLKNTSVIHMLSALLGGAFGLGVTLSIGAALNWATLMTAVSSFYTA